MHAPRAILVCTLLAAVGCGSGSNATPTPSPVGADVTTESQPIERLLSQQHSGLQERTELAIADRATLERTWLAIHGGVAGNAAPAVDFAQRTVIVVGLGERSSGGHAVRVDTVAREGDTTVVRYTASAPGAGCMTTQAITSPVEVVSVPRVAGQVRFERRDASVPC